MNKNNFDNKKQLLANKTIICLIVLFGIGIFIRLYYFEPDLPITLDGLSYFSYAGEISRIGSLPENFSPSNNGWSIFVSLFFTLITFDNALEYMQLQKNLSIILSALTIFPVYLFCRKFFERHYSLLGAAIFIFEPRLIQNSLFGITESLYILLGTISLVLFLGPKKFVYISFAIAALTTIIRAEGLFIFFAISILFIIKYRQEKFKIVLKYGLVITIFVIILLPIAVYKIDIHEEDRMVSRIAAGIDHENQIFQKIFVGSENFVKFVGWSMIPIFIFFVPVGTILFLRKINFQKLVIIITVVSMSLPAFYAYSIPALDSRFLFFLYPIFCVISLYAIKPLLEKILKQHIVMILIVILIIVASITFLEIKKIDKEYEEDALQFSLKISDKISGVNSYYPEDQYLASSAVIKNWPDVAVSDKYGNVKMNFVIISTDSHSSLKEFIQDSQKKELSHLVIDNNENRPDFLKIDPNEYTFLKNVEITIDSHGKYNAKLYQIDYNEFFKIYDEG
jgi:hypothetical protein